MNMRSLLRSVLKANGIQLHDEIRGYQKNAGGERKGPRQKPSLESIWKADNRRKADAKKEAQP